jgi:hypothetical protein
MSEWMSGSHGLSSCSGISYNRRPKTSCWVPQILLTPIMLQRSWSSVRSRGHLVGVPPVGTSAQADARLVGIGYDASRRFHHSIVAVAYWGLQVCVWSSVHRQRFLLPAHGPIAARRSEVVVLRLKVQVGRRLGGRKVLLLPGRRGRRGFINWLWVGRYFVLAGPAHTHP